MRPGVRDYRADLLKDLKDVQCAAKYLSAAHADSPEALLVALRDVAEAQKDTELTIPEMTQDEAVAAANYTAQHYFGIDAPEFLERLQAGTLPDDKMHLVRRVLSMICVK